ncbi:hypothetical protein MB901379_04781 [Mycobacterium basiliense]|uniref:Uncharacterized protein n=1 Tax=Mycobacterium basiliense TaxID=2094119 RepID=A0A447GKY6_9MYCO|nr:hypothetical protein [Mycobacterium basiliense]VDM91164.1 hypothetical protein MB901379_04781 [Mycobacterium basiliense]
MNSATSDRIDSILLPAYSDEALEGAGGMGVAAITILNPTAK